MWNRILIGVFIISISIMSFKIFKYHQHKNHFENRLKENLKLARKSMDINTAYAYDGIEEATTAYSQFKGVLVKADTLGIMTQKKLMNFNNDILGNDSSLYILLVDTKDTTELKSNYGFLNLNKQQYILGKSPLAKEIILSLISMQQYNWMAYLYEYCDYYHSHYYNFKTITFHGNRLIPISSNFDFKFGLSQYIDPPPHLRLYMNDSLIIPRKKYTLQPIKNGWNNLKLEIRDKNDIVISNRLQSYFVTPCKN